MQEAIGPIMEGPNARATLKLGLTSGLDVDEADNDVAVRFGWKARIRAHGLPSQRTVKGQKYEAGSPSWVVARK